ncbi:MAG TPA: hypothetical protein VJ596_08685, partial [Gemmatimonadaceae bacterium]|nr:hypothetical protein [Gemmatimonadaceae bacterium]
VSFALSRGTPEVGLAPLAEPCGTDCTRPIARSASAPRGLAPGVRAAVRGRIVRRAEAATLSLPSLPLDVKPGEWLTVEIALRSRADGNATNDRLLLIFVLDERGEVVESRTERPAERPASHARLHSLGAADRRG